MCVCVCVCVRACVHACVCVCTLIIRRFVFVGTEYLDGGKTFNPIPPSELLVFVCVDSSNSYYTLQNGEKRLAAIFTVVKITSLLHHCLLHFDSHSKPLPLSCILEPVLDSVHTYDITITSSTFFNPLLTALTRGHKTPLPRRSGCW